MSQPVNTQLHQILKSVKCFTEDCKKEFKKKDLYIYTNIIGVLMSIEDYLAVQLTTDGEYLVPASDETPEEINKILELLYDDIGHTANAIHKETHKRSMDAYTDFIDYLRQRQAYIGYYEIFDNIYLLNGRECSESKYSQSYSESKYSQYRYGP